MISENCLTTKIGFELKHHCQTFKDYYLALFWNSILMKNIALIYGGAGERQDS